MHPDPVKPCTQWKPTGHPERGDCKLHRRTCSLAFCESCPDNDGGSRWLAFRRRNQIGTKIEKVTRAVGVKPCGGCSRRKQYLNGENP